MIPIDKLRAATTIVAHQNGPGSPCPDGVASALILRDVLPDALVTFASHDQAGELLARPGLLFCDVTPPASRAADFINAGAIVLDHHKSAREVVDAFGECGVFADEDDEPGVSGAMLAYREVWLPLADDMTSARRRAYAENVEHFARVAGVRDTWQRASEWWTAACAQAAALAFWPFELWPSLSLLRDDDSELCAMLAIGPVLVERRAREVHRHIANGWRFETQKGTRVLVLATTQTSDVAEEMGNAVDLVIGFSFANGTALGDAHAERMQISTRSRASFDCAAFCKANGGGGHARAAGFSLALRPDDGQPYTLVAEIVDAFEQSGRGLRAATPF